MAGRGVACVVAIVVTGGAWANDHTEQLDSCEPVKVGGRVEQTRTNPPEGRTGVEGADLIFESEDGSIHGKARSDARGWYAVKLPPARYVVWVTADGYEYFTTHPGFVVVRDCEIRHRFNVFLTPHVEP